MIIMQCLRWYLRYPLSYRNLVEIMEERGVDVAHSTILRWIQHYGPIFAKEIRYYTRPTGGTWRVDETYIRVRGKWKYLYRALDQRGGTIDFLLTHRPSAKSAKQFLRKALLQAGRCPNSINTDKNPAYGIAIEKLKKAKILKKSLEHQQVKYLNNIIESDHRRVKRRTRPMMGFNQFHSARKTLQGIEAMAMVLKTRNYYIRHSAKEQNTFIHKLFGIYNYG